MLYEHNSSWIWNKFSAWIRNQWLRHMDLLTTPPYSWGKGTEWNSLEGVRGAELLSSPFLCSSCLPPDTTGNNWRSFLSRWPPSLFSSSCGNKATGTQCCHFPGSHPWPTWQTVVTVKGKAHTFTSPVSQVRQWDVLDCPDSFCCPLGTPPHRVSVRATTGSHSDSLQSIVFLAVSPHSILSPGFVGQEISRLPWVAGLPASPRCHQCLQAVKL